VTEEVCRTGTVTVHLLCEVTIQNALDISDIYYNIFLSSDLNIIYFLTNRTCVKYGMHEFSIAL
jgi:hypothetical protein